MMVQKWAEKILRFAQNDMIGWAAALSQERPVVGERVRRVAPLRGELVALSHGGAVAFQTLSGAKAPPLLTTDEKEILRWLQ
jgi:hypothetical protein